MDFCRKVKSSSIIQITVFIFLNLIPSSVQNTEYVKNYYTKELLLLWHSNAITLSNINVHRKTNTLYFCLNNPRNYDSQIGFYNIDTKETEIIRKIRKGCANAVDQENNEVYLGGLKGIYKYNMETTNPEFYAEKDVHIKSLFYNERLYYIRNADQKVLMEFEGEFALISEFIDLKLDHFHVGKDGIVYFTVANSIYIYDKNQTEWDLKGLRKAHTVNAISEDNNGKVYLCTTRGVFTVIRNGLRKYMNEENIVGLTTDRDNNLILADYVSIFRLLRND